MEKIEEKVDRILEAVGDAKTTQHHKMKHTRKLMGLPVSTVIMYLGVVMVGALLCTGYSWYSMTVQSDIALNGGSQLAFYWDGALIPEQVTSVSADVTTLTSGDLMTYPHSMYSPGDDGNYIVSFDTSAMDEVFNDPLNIWYGFYFDIQDSVTHESVMDDEIVILHGQPAKTIDFVYNLDSHFLDTELPLPFELVVSVDEKPNEAPVGVADGGEGAYDSNIIIHATTNDYDPDLDTFTINTAEHLTGSYQLVSFDANDVTIHITYEHVTSTFRYNLIDEHGLISDWITISVTGA